ncbi:MAG: glycosyltransferase family 4 protein [Chloroflexota bacterium]
MKIALVSPYDFAFPGGVTNHITSLGRHLVRLGQEVKVIAPASKAVTDLGDRFIPIGKPRPVPASGSICRVTLSLRLASQVKAVLEEEKFDLIHLHEPLMPMLCTTVLRLSPAVNVGTFHAFHGMPGYQLGYPLTTILLKRWCRKLDGRIAVSQPAREFVSRYFPARYEIIPNGVDLEYFSPRATPREEFLDGKLNILFVGRLEKRKGAGYLLKAYREMKRAVPEARLIIVGPGTRLRKKYERLVRRDGIEDVVFTGHVSPEELPRYYQSADIFCSPATGFESFGIVLLEAMAMSKPVVASRIEGYSYVVSHGVDGLLVPPRDSKALAEALGALARDRSRRRQMGVAGRAKAEQYGWEHIARKVLDFYRQTLDQRAARGVVRGELSPVP